MIRERPFGTLGDQRVRAFEVDGGDGLSIKVSDYGARLVEAHVPDRQGRLDDVVLGFDDTESYAKSTAFFGATIGRYANRIGGGRFVLEGEAVLVDRNESPNHLHGGACGWDTQLWSAEPHEDGRGITFRLTSPDGDMGFPGTCEASCSYRIDGLRLRITMDAVSDRTTVINMAHHSYVNLGGHASGDILDQQLRIPGDYYLPVDEALLPTGEVRYVAKTPYDFRVLRRIGEDIGSSSDAEHVRALGYDHNYCLRGDRHPTEHGLHEAMEAYDPRSGRHLRVWTTEPGLQLYTGGAIGPGVVGKGGARYLPFAGFTLEAQKFPDSPNHLHFPSPVVAAGQQYRQVQVLEFAAT